MSYHGDIRLGDTIDIKFTTRRFSTGAPHTLAGTPAVAAYVGNGTTEITAGITLTVDFDARTGLNNVRVVATSGNGFAAATNVQLVITAGTVDSVSVVGEVVGEFSIENRSALMPTAAGRTLDVAATGEAGLDFDNIKQASGATTLTNITVPTVTTTTTATNVTTVNGLAAGVLTAAAIAGDAFTAAKFAAGAFDAVWTVAARVLTAGTNIVLAKGTGVTGFNDLSAAQVESECNDALVALNLDHLVKVAVDTDFFTTVHLDSVIGHVVDNGTSSSFSRTTDSLEALRDRGDAAWVTATGFSTLDAAGVRAAVGLAAANLDTQLADLPTVAEFNARTLAAADYFVVGDYTAPPTVAQIRQEMDSNSADLDAIGTLATAIKAKTDLIPAGGYPANFSALGINASGHVSRVVLCDTLTTNGDKTGYALSAAGISSILTTQMTEAYNADGTAPTLAQSLFVIMQALTEFVISGTTNTVKRLDGSTTAFTLTLNDGTSPTGVTRAS